MADTEQVVVVPTNSADANGPTLDAVVTSVGDPEEWVLPGAPEKLAQAAVLYQRTLPVFEDWEANIRRSSTGSSDDVDAWITNTKNAISEWDPSGQGLVPWSLADATPVGWGWSGPEDWGQVNLVIDGDPFDARGTPQVEVFFDVELVDGEWKIVAPVGGVFEQEVVGQ